MGKVQITVRDVDEETFKEFKSRAAISGDKLGNLLNFAMIKYMGDVRTGKKFSDLKPFSWGKGSEKISEQIDEILYG